MGVAVEQPHLQLGFQGSDVLADGSLRHGVGCGGLGKAEALGQGDEVFDLLFSIDRFLRWRASGIFSLSLCNSLGEKSNDKFYR